MRNLTINELSDVGGGNTDGAIALAPTGTGTITVDDNGQITCGTGAPTQPKFKRPKRRNPEPVLVVCE